MQGTSGEYDHLISAIAKLEVEVAELRFEAHFNRATTLVVLVFLIERVWHHFF
jgi:hypothetical protein